MVLRLFYIKDFKMKRLTLVFLLCASTIASWAHAFVMDGIYYNIISSTSLTVEVTCRGYSGSDYSNEYSGTVTIPSTVTYNSKTYSVTSIGNEAFYNCSSLTSVTIPARVTSIGNSAFEDCSNLTSITIPASVTSIGNYAFRDCSNLASITIPKSVTSIGSDAFKGSTWYNNQPDGVVYAGRVLYMYKGTMPWNTSIKVQEGTASINPWAFFNCSGLTSIYIPNSVTSIGERAFFDCDEITSFNLPSNMTVIGSEAFHGCRSLTSINIPEGITNIEKSTFEGCSSLTSVTIPKDSKLTSIGERAFFDCERITFINIPSNVTKIGSYAFYNCNRLYKVINHSKLPISKGMGDYGYVAYYAGKVLNANVLTNIGEYQFYTSNDVHYLANYIGKNNSLVLPDKYSGESYQIDEYAFYDCKEITSINIPENVTSIGYRAFLNCTSLKEVIFADGSETLILGYNSRSSSTGGAGLFSNCPLEKVHWGRNLSYEDYWYGYSPFYNKDALCDVTIGSKVTEINKYAFFECSNLTSVTIPEGVKSIGDRAFEDCNNLNSINIPESITSIGDAALRNCSNLSSINIPKSVTSIGSNAFSGCNNLVNIHIGSIESWLKIRYGDFSAHPNYSGKDIKLYLNGELLTKVEVSATITDIPPYAFCGCSSLTAINIPESVTSIGNSAFYGCSSLNSITIPQSVTSIGNKTFYMCKFNPILLNCHLTGVDNFGWDDTSVIYLYKNDYNRVKAKNGGTYYMLEDAYRVDITNTYMKGFTFEVIKDNDFPLSNELKRIMVNDIELQINSEGIYQIKDLKTNTSYTVSLTYLTDDGQEVKLEHIIETSKPEIDFSYTTTNTTIEIPTLTASSDITNPAGETGISIKTSDYKTSTYTYTGSPITIKNLRPNKEYTIYSYAYYGEEKVYGKSYKVTTQSLTPQIELLDLTPTSFTAKGKYANIDATVNETGFTDYDASELLTLTGLDPSTKYTIEYYVKTKEGSNEKVTRTFTTPALEMTTLNPKVVSNSCAIVAATTNMSDEETNAGFQWRKYEAPETLPSSEGYAAIYDGQLEGYIKNLQATSFYNVRAFYKSTAGKYYYSDWVTFDPSDFSYFEPTVHTYPTEELTANSAKVKGYVLQGTDAITEQGFVYWPTGTNKANATRSVTVPENASIVIAKGQVMNVTLEGLTPSTTYNFCAFVTTASGTIYGEEHSFTTKANETGIESLESEQPTPTIIGYYDLNGRKLSEPQHGITIVRYSDGTARKILTE